MLTATAVYPTLALLNHSCDPNIVKYFDGKRVVVTAGKKIAKGFYSYFRFLFYTNVQKYFLLRIFFHIGEEVTENYFPFYPYISTEDRMKFLKKHYCFDCG